MKLGPFKMIVIPPASDQSAETFLLEAHVFKPKGRYSKSQPIINLNPSLTIKIWKWSGIGLEVAKLVIWRPRGQVFPVVLVDWLQRVAFDGAQIIPLVRMVVIMGVSHRSNMKVCGVNPSNSPVVEFCWFWELMKMSPFIQFFFVKVLTLNYSALQFFLALLKDLHLPCRGFVRWLQTLFSFFGATTPWVVLALLFRTMAFISQLILSTSEFSLIWISSFESLSRMFSSWKRA